MLCRVNASYDLGAQLPSWYLIHLDSYMRSTLDIC